MASLSLPQGTHTGGSHGVVPSFGARLMAFFDILGASIRVARAAETGSPARPEDLATLGIKGPLPRSW